MISCCISSVISIHFLMKLFEKDLPEDKKKIFLKACLNYLLKKMSLIISLVRRTIHYENPLLSGKVNRQHNN